MPPIDIRTYDISLEYGVVIRVRSWRDRNIVTRFTVQLEFYDSSQDKWLPVVRYDTAHGEAHVDYINPQGRQYNKVWLNLRYPYNVAMKNAIDTLKLNYAVHIARFKEQQHG